MKEISLSKGAIAIVDDEDFVNLSRHKWTAAGNPSARTLYAMRSAPGTNGRRRSYVMMHREILGLPSGSVPQVDHRNHDGLDNRRANLRLATPLQNSGNTRKPKGSRYSRFKGVTRSTPYPTKGTRPWVASITLARKQYHLGRFWNEEEAARAYDAAAKEAFGDFAWLNFPDE